MRNRRLLLVLASLLLSLSAHAAPPSQTANAGARGVPFERLQQQIDQLRERIQALENASPAGQSCPPGQFITGFNSAGGILCATTTGGGTPTPPPTPAPVPQAFLAALQQAILGLAGQNVPFQTSSPTTTITPGFTITTLPQTYSLTIGTISFSQPNAVSLAIQVLVPAFSLTVDVSVTSLVGSGSGTLVIGTTNAVANVSVSIVDTTAGMRRLGLVTAVNISPGSTFVTGTLGNSLLDNFIQGNLFLVEGPVADVLESAIDNAAGQVLLTLPDF